MDYGLGQVAFAKTRGAVHEKTVAFGQLHPDVEREGELRTDSKGHHGRDKNCGSDWGTFQSGGGTCDGTGYDVDWIFAEPKI